MKNKNIETIYRMNSRYLCLCPEVILGDNDSPDSPGVVQDVEVIMGGDLFIVQHSTWGEHYNSFIIQLVQDLENINPHL